MLSKINSHCHSFLRVTVNIFFIVSCIIISFINNTKKRAEKESEPKVLMLAQEMTACQWSSWGLNM